FVVLLVSKPGSYCTPADIAAQGGARSFAVRSATVEECDLRVEAADAEGKKLTVLDFRVALPASSDPGHPASACGAVPGDLQAQPELPGIATFWKQPALGVRVSSISQITPRQNPRP